jgi:hypothetical protein
MRSTDAALASIRIHQALTTRFGKLGVKLLHTLHEGETKNRKQKAGSRQHKSKQQTAGSRHQKVNSRQQIAEKRAIRKKETDR